MTVTVAPYLIAFAFLQPLFIQLLVGVHFARRLGLTCKNLPKAPFAQDPEVHEPLLIDRLTLQPFELNESQEVHAVLVGGHGGFLQVFQHLHLTLLEQIAADVLSIFLHPSDGLFLQKAAKTLRRGFEVIIDNLLGLLASFLLLADGVVFYVFPQLASIFVGCFAVQKLLEEALADRLLDTDAVKGRVYGALRGLTISDVGEIQFGAHLLVTHSGCGSSIHAAPG